VSTINSAILHLEVRRRIITYKMLCQGPFINYVTKVGWGREPKYDNLTDTRGHICHMASSKIKDFQECICIKVYYFECTLEYRICEMNFTCKTCKTYQLLATHSDILQFVVSTIVYSMPVVQLLVSIGPHPGRTGLLGFLMLCCQTQNLVKRQGVEFGITLSHQKQ
jgi:hypothetical protein